MTKIIQQKLNEIEQAENIRILIAVESGSRAWGFASPDSDYDVRFIYVRQIKDYLKLEKFRDVLEIPINDDLDINGWDLNKALRLLHSSNPVLFEWLNSPIIYKTTDCINQFKTLADEYFSLTKTLHHYLNTAIHNYQVYFKNDLVKAKKYFYVLRPILATKWILENKSAPPMSFNELVKTQLPNSLKDEVDFLLELKTKSSEIKEINKIGKLDRYLIFSMEEIKTVLNSLQKEPMQDWNKLNQFFVSQLEK